MTNEKLTLQDIAQRASSRNGDVKGRALDRIAKQRGLVLSYTTVDKILQGKYTSRPGEATLNALSQLSGVPLEDVFEAAGQALPQARLADQLPPEVDRLTPEQRRVVIDLARVFVKQNRELEALRGRDGNVSTAPITHAGESPATEDASGDELRARRESNTSSITVDDSRDRLVARRVKGAKKLDEDTTDDPA